MPPAKKRQKLYEQQSRTSDGRFGPKIMNQRLSVRNDSEGVDDYSFELEIQLESAEEWGNDDDSGWEDEIDLEKEKEAQSKFMMAKLEWNVNNEFEKKKRGPYKTRETPRSTYYDKWGPSGSFTRSAIGTSKITNFFPTQSNTDDEIINLDHDIVDESEQSESEEENLCDVNIDVNGKMKASLSVAQIIFIDGGIWKARQIRHWSNYWLLHNALPISFQGKHQKTVRLIDDEDVAEKCHVWIRNQNYKVTPIKFKKFIEQNLLTQLGVSKKKTIDVSTAVRWLHILGYTKQRQKQGVYYDGHERADVVQYRNKFLSDIFEYEKLMSRYEGENMDQILPDLAEGEKE
ncbi:hypothetical protein RhiirA4_508603 [Rhizophagus irregularis]|uniref:Uncharacterized protein n=1 Tax=Rhizophagus irregularis TaxID=588596 RepID=A0A2I1HDN6_9GLOM|nr:hypothetical protein RhiirA4_508603 [Rhizophagus irregularis]